MRLRTSAYTLPANPGEPSTIANASNIRDVQCYSGKGMRLRRRVARFAGRFVLSQRRLGQVHSGVSHHRPFQFFKSRVVTVSKTTCDGKLLAIDQPDNTLDLCVDGVLVADVLCS
jgi:hypothetical protein